MYGVLGLKLLDSLRLGKGRANLVGALTVNNRHRCRPAAYLITRSHQQRLGDLIHLERIDPFVVPPGGNRRSHVLLKTERPLS